MRPQDLRQLLAKTITKGLPVLIKGAPGIGKSDIVTQACEEAGAELLLMHPVVSDPTDFKGLPAVVKDKAEFLPFGDLKQLMTTKKLTVCFLDDLGQAPAVVQAACMQLILARQINGHKISDTVVFIAATNRREDRAGVTGILEPVKSRFATIIELTPNVEDWTTWAIDNDVPAEVIAFVRFRPQLLTSPGEATNDIVNRACPRTVTNMAKLYALGIENLESLSGAAGAGFATEFLGFLKVWKSMPNIDSILISPDTQAVPTDPAALYAVSTALATRITENNAPNVIRYISRLPEEFAALAIRDAHRVCPRMANCKEFIRWIATHQDILV